MFMDEKTFVIKILRGKTWTIENIPEKAVKANRMRPHLVYKNKKKFTITSVNG